MKSRYNIIKRKCRDLLKTLKKVRFWLYEMQFIIEIDANILMTQLNHSVANLLKILIIHWLTWIKFFNFDVKHIFEKKHITVDDLFRRFQDFLNDINEIYEKDIDEFINE